MKELRMTFKTTEEYNDFFETARKIASSDIVNKETKRIAKVIVSSVKTSQAKTVDTTNSMIEFFMLKVPFTRSIASYEENGTHNIYVVVKSAYRVKRDRHMYDQIVDYFLAKHPYMSLNLTISVSAPTNLPANAIVATPELLKRLVSNKA